RAQQRIDLNDRRLYEQLRRGGRSGDEQVGAEAQVLPGIVDVCLRDTRSRRVVRDRIQVQEVAKVHRGEERVLGAEARGHEVCLRGARRLAGLVQVAGVAGGAIQQR